MIDETGKVVFEETEQAEVNRIVEERLARERGKYTDYEDLKGTIDELNALGYQGSAKEVKEAIRAVREQTEREAELQDLQRQAETEGTSPEVLKEIRDLKKELAEIKKDKQEKLDAVKHQQDQQEQLNAMVEEFNETYPDVDLEQLNNDEEFLEFVRDANPNLSLVKVYERYTKYTRGAQQKAAAKIQTNLDRSTSSGKSKGRQDTFGLTAEQRETVDEWNKSNPRMKMTYAEFSSNLRR